MFPPIYFLHTAQSFSSHLTLSYQIKVAAVFLVALTQQCTFCVGASHRFPQAQKSIIKKTLAIGVPKVTVCIAKVSIFLSLSRNIPYLKETPLIVYIIHNSN